MGQGVKRLRRRTYALMLALGWMGLLWLVLWDAEAALTGARAAVGRAGGGLTALTAGSVLDGFGSWSPDGKQIAFMRNGQIWVMPARGGEGRALTRREGMWDTAPAWHPQGGKIAWIRFSPDRSEAGILLLNLRGGPERELIREAEPIGALAWAPDGQSLYYTTATRLKRLDVTRRKAEPVLELDSSWDLLPGGLAISGDGRTAIFGAGRKTGGAQYDLWLLPLHTAGAVPEQLTRGGGIMPALDSTGRLLVYRNPRQRTGIYVMDLERHTTRQVVADEPGALYFHPRFSPDGGRLLVSRLLLSASPSGGGQREFVSHLYVRRGAASGW
ncbi:MAG TPA: hypothetical protein VIL07_10890 [Symbiobacteriaceae bacterium]